MTKTRLFIIVAIILVVLGSGAAFGVWQARGGNFTSSPPKAAKEVPQYTPDQRQKLVDEVNKKYGTGDYEGAIELIEGQGDRQNIDTQLLLAGAYANAGNAKKALEIYQELDRAGKLPETAIANMATMAERAGEYQTAIDAYKRAKQYARDSATENDDQVAVYDYQIAALEKKL